MTVLKLSLSNEIDWLRKGYSQVNCFLFRIPGSSLRRAAETRFVRLKRIQVEVGVQICGGNLSGIFVESLDDDSPAKIPDGLLPGDLILEVSTVFQSHVDYLTNVHNK